MPALTGFETCSGGLRPSQNTSSQKPILSRPSGLPLGLDIRLVIPQGYPRNEFGKLTAMQRNILIPNLLAALVALAMLTACRLNPETGGQSRVFDVAYETVTNKLWVLPPNPDSYYPSRVTNTVATNAMQGSKDLFQNQYFQNQYGPMVPMSYSGHERVAGQFYEFYMHEALMETIVNTMTIIRVTRIDSKSTRVQIKTTRSGLYFDTRVWSIEEQRLDELSQLLSKKSQP